MTETPATHLANLARDLVANPHFLAHGLDAAQCRLCLTDGQLAGLMGLPAGRLTYLRLCRTLGAGRHSFEGDIATIAARAGCDPARLADLLPARS